MDMKYLLSMAYYARLWGIRWFQKRQISNLKQLTGRESRRERRGREGRREREYGRVST